MRLLDWKRKLTHAGFGLFAFALRWLSWPAAAACALAALLVNVFLLPKFGKGIYRDAGSRRDPGIVAYPAMVLLLILLYRQHLEIAAAVWAMMALGDPAASFAGMTLRGPALPWNPRKTWAGTAAYFLVGGAAAAVLYVWVTPGLAANPARLGWIIAPAAAVAAFLESYPCGLDDNWVTPIPASLMIFGAVAVAFPGGWPSPAELLTALGANAAVALAAGLLRVVSPSGAMAGALAGSVILAFGGWPAYAVLWTFFLAGTLATKLGYREKARRGTAQSAGGRRGARHVAANCGVGIVLAVLFFASRGAPRGLLAAAFAASFAAALADTFGTEFGSLYGRRAFSMTRLRRVPAGTRGAVSLAGTAAGLAGGLLVAAIAAGTGWMDPRAIPAVALAGLAGSLAESLVLDLAERRGQRLDHEFVNALNTLAGGLAAMGLLGWAR